MKTIVMMALSCAWLTTALGQPAAIALEGNTQTPQERFLLLKLNSVTYQDYKVVHEATLNRVWDILNDSLKKRDRQLSEATGKVTQLQNEVTFVRAELKAKESSMAEIKFDSTHVSVMGINFSKGAFILMALISCFLLSASIAVLILRLKIMLQFVKESKVIVSSTASELEEYKQKAMDKYFKISRELQTERNKLIELQQTINTR